MIVAFAIIYYNCINPTNRVVKGYMKFEKIFIKNFINFEDIELKLSNNNIFFGVNDVGKNNLLYAICYVFDWDIRR